MRRPNNKTLGIFCLLLFQGFLIAQGCLAHEVRPSYLALEESSTNNFTVIWKRPIKDGAAPDLTPQFPEQCQLALQPLVELTGAAKIQRGTLSCGEQGLNRGQIRIDGLAITLMDVFVRIQWLNGDSRQSLLKRSDTGLSLDEEATPPIADYIGLGFEHILSGYDHLLFLLALLLIVSSKMGLLKTVTVFTLAHSITLALATLGVVNVPSAPVEACIALSITLIAAEAIYKRRGFQSLAISKPWLVVFLFGLLHGLGFAGALTEMGLPQGDIPLALVLFNVGIELGQLLFVFVALLLAALVKRLIAKGFSRWGFFWNDVSGNVSYNVSTYVPAYGIGIIGVFWSLERAAGIIV